MCCILVGIVGVHLACVPLRAHVQGMVVLAEQPVTGTMRHADAAMRERERERERALLGTIL